jgi:hypothetical protein
MPLAQARQEELGRYEPVLSEPQPTAQMLAVTETGEIASVGVSQEQDVIEN